LSGASAVALLALIAIAALVFAWRADDRVRSSERELVRRQQDSALQVTEGTLVASYNRGMRVLTEAGGVKTTVVEQAMQRAPVFALEDAREAREFGRWVEEHFAQIKVAAEATTRTGKLVNIGQYSVGPLRYLRFNYTTGDAAGQNLTSKATLRACAWIRAQYPGIRDFYLEANLATGLYGHEDGYHDGHGQGGFILTLTNTGGGACSAGGAGAAGAGVNIDGGA